MTKSYRPDWDLSTIPEAIWKSEHGRRNRAKQEVAPNLKLKPCKGCKTRLSATERRRACPQCGFRNVIRDKKGNWVDA